MNESWKGGTRLELKLFNIDGWLVSPGEHSISRDGETVRLEPKVMELLVYFASRQGQVITRDELEEKVWHGALVGYDALTATIAKLRKALNDNTKKPRIIVTVPKRGYQLVASVSEINQSADESMPFANDESPLAEITTHSQNTHKSPWLVISISFMGIILLAWFVISSTNQPVKSPSILVLPIENMDNDKTYEVFLDGITEDLVTDLSRFSNLTVLASNTSFQYKGRNVPTKELQQTLAIDYILKGSARRTKDTMRVNLQLIDARKGINLWAQRYDRYTEEIFSLQDEIITNLISHLKIEANQPQTTDPLKRATNNLQAYELFLEAQRLSRIQSRQSNQQARELYKQAITKDPGYGRAYGAIAYTLALDYRHSWTDTPVENLERALQMAKKGIELNPYIPQTYWSLSYVHLRRKESNKALDAARQSIRVAPNYADGYALLGLITNGLAKFDEALTYIRTGKKLNPYYSWDYLFNEGFAQYMKGNYQQAIAILKQGEARNENAIPLKLGLAASYVQINNQDEAEWTIEQIKMLNPATTIEHLGRTFVIQVQPYKDNYLNTLRKAGLPEK